MLHHLSRWGSGGVHSYAYWRTWKRALIATIEIYDKPAFGPQRKFAVLARNSWELRVLSLTSRRPTPAFGVQCKKKCVQGQTYPGNKMMNGDGMSRSRI